MAHQADDNVIETVVQLLCENGLSHMSDAMRLMLNEAMRIERSQALEADPYQRTEKRRGYANGFKPKTVSTRLGELALQVPQVRGEIDFYPSALERGVRSERALKCAIAEMYVQGVSTRKVTEVMRELCGLEVSSTQVSRATRLLDEDLNRWRNRPLGEVPYVFVDARYEKIRHGGSVVPCAVLMAFGVDQTGHRTVLGVSVSLSEAEVHWRDFFAGLQERGLSGVRLLISDDHAGMKAAREARFPGVPWQRCQFHLQQSRMPDITCHGWKCAVRLPVICGRSSNPRTGRKLIVVCVRRWTSTRSGLRNSALGWTPTWPKVLQCLRFPRLTGAACVPRI